MDFLYGAREPTLPYHILLEGQEEKAFPKATKGRLVRGAPFSVRVAICVDDI